MPAKKTKTQRKARPLPTMKAARITTYSDSGQVIAHIDWSNNGTTSGDPKGPHMQALLARAEREGIPVKRETW